MADDKTPDETTEGQEPQDAGPVAEETSSASQASAEEAPSTPPASEAPDANAESPAEAESTADESAPEAEEPSEEPAAEEQAEPEAVEEAPVAEEPSEEAPAAEESAAPAEEPKAEQPKTEKKDVIPGADLEPIAVEPEAPLSAEERARLEAEEEEKARREAELASVEEPASRAPAKMESGARFLATGKRKRSIARVTLLPGNGKVEVNKRSLEEFFPRPLHQTIAVQPLAVSGYEGNVDVRVRVHGGGISGQAGAVRHGIARALTEIDPELRGDLKRRGFLTRDARVKERRKAGLKKARKKPQFSKR
jgi:small subunit ribosomal protein S9